MKVARVRDGTPDCLKFRERMVRSAADTATLLNQSRTRIETQTACSDAPGMPSYSK